MMKSAYTIHVGDCRQVMADLPERHFHCCVTSPPYFGLRDYGTSRWAGGDNPDCNHRIPATGGNQKQGANKGNNNAEGTPYRDVCGKCGAIRVDDQLGLEPTPDEFVAAMVEVFRGVWRVLRHDGVLWLNLGDSYSSGGRGSYGSFSPDSKQATHTAIKSSPRPGMPDGIKPKDLLGIPWRVAFALQADGWYLRDAIIWHKPAPMPGSQRDRCTSSYEFIFQLTKRPRYYFDMEAVKEPCAEQVVKEPDGWDVGDGSHGTIHREGRSKGRPNAATISTRVPRNVWKMANEGFKGAHFATFPRELPTRCIKASTSERDCCPSCGAGWVRLVERDRKPTRPGKNNASDDTGMANRDEQRHVTETRTTGWERGCDCSDNGSPPVPCRVLDPFHGAGTTAIAACLLGCEYVGIELNPDYAQMSRERIDRELNPSTARTDTEEPSPLFAG